MDYLKIITLALSPIIAIYAILVTYKTKNRTGDPTTEKEVLTLGGKVALALVIIAGLFSFFSELSSQRKEKDEKSTETRQIMEQLNKLHKQQETLNRTSNMILRQTEESLLLLRQFKGEAGHGGQRLVDSKQ